MNFIKVWFFFAFSEVFAEITKLATEARNLMFNLMLWHLVILGLVKMVGVVYKILNRIRYSLSIELNIIMNGKRSTPRKSPLVLKSLNSGDLTMQYECVATTQVQSSNPSGFKKIMKHLSDDNFFCNFYSNRPLKIEISNQEPYKRCEHTLDAHQIQLELTNSSINHNIETIMRNENRASYDTKNLTCESGYQSVIKQNNLSALVKYQGNYLKYIYRTHSRISKRRRKAKSDNKKTLSKKNAQNACLITHYTMSESQVQEYKHKKSSISITENDKVLDNCCSTTKAFSELRNFLKMVFALDFDNLVDHVLDYDQLSIAASIISKKFLIDFPIKSIYRMESFRSLYGMRTSKRPEESYKFVFKYGFKYLKENLKAQEVQISKLGSIDFNTYFYDYYFGKTSKDLNIEVNQFFLPLIPDSYCNRNQKVIAQTINVSYITLVCQSSRFMKDFPNYMNVVFIKDYRALINRKVDDLCDKWEQMHLEVGGDGKLIGYICDYIIIINKLFKLPLLGR